MYTETDMRWLFIFKYDRLYAYNLIWKKKSNLFNLFNSSSFSVLFSESHKNTIYSKLNKNKKKSYVNLLYRMSDFLMCFIFILS